MYSGTAVFLVDVYSDNINAGLVNWQCTMRKVAKTQCENWGIRKMETDDIKVDVYNAENSIVPIFYCLLLMACSQLHIAYCLLPIAH